jgi:hypothetical protein
MIFVHRPNGHGYGASEPVRVVSVKESMVSGDSEYSGDYAYDLAHEMKAVLALPTSRPGRRPGGAAPMPRREVDPDGDLGYDAAHEI